MRGIIPSENSESEILNNKLSMTWYILALLGAFFDSAYYISVKLLLKGIDKYALGGMTFLISGIMLAILNLVVGMPSIGNDFWWAAAIAVIANTLTIYFNYKSLSLGDISLVLPLITFTPLFLLLTSYVILGEKPSVYGIVGLLLLVAGAYVLNQKKRLSLEPFKALGEKASLYMIAAALIMSITANFDKIAIKASNPYFEGMAVTTLVGVILLSVGMSQARNKKKYKSQIRNNIPKFLLTGLFISMVIALVNSALQSNLVSYVISIKRTSLIYSVLIGGVLFKEKNLGPRLIGTVVMIIGAVVIIAKG